MVRTLLTIAWFALAAAPARAQDTLPGSRITNAGVVRATRATAAVFLNRTRLTDTVDIGDFAALMLAKIGAPPFSDSLAFKVTSDSARIRVSGRLMDFPPDSRAELGPIFSFLDSTSVFVAEISMPQAQDGIIIFRLERLSVRGFPIPDLLVLAALDRYRQQYPGMLAAGGKEFHVEIPREARARLVHDGIALVMPAKP